MTNSLFKVVFIYTTLTFLFTAFLYSENKTLVRELIAHSNDSVFRYTFLYDDFNNKVVENKYVVTENSVPLPLLRTEWVYEANNCILQRQQKWNKERWETFYLIESNYENRLQRTEKYITVTDTIEHVDKTLTFDYSDIQLKSIKTYNGTTTEGQLVKTENYLYDGMNQLINLQIVGVTTAGITFNKFYNYTYDTIGKIKTMTFGDIQNETLVDKQLIIYAYDLEGRLASQIQKKYVDAKADWEGQAKSVFNYSASGQLTREIYSHYGGEFWIPNVMYEYIYDSQDVLLSKVTYQPFYRQWRKMNTIQYSQLENERPGLMESTYNFWGGVAGQPVKNFIPYYFNNEISIKEANRIELKYTIDYSGINQPSSEGDQLKIYPNPSIGVFYINTQQLTIDSWEVYNLNGVKVKATNNQYRTGIVDLTDFSDGMYMIKATTNDKRQLKQKIIIQRNQ